MYRHILVVGVLVCVSASLVSAGEGQKPVTGWDVGIRECYLRGIGASDVWSAAKAIGVTRLELVVDGKLACPEMFEGGKKPYGIETAEDRKALLKACQEHGVSIAAFCAVVGGGKKGPDSLAVQWLTRIAEAAGEMKVPVIMVPLGYSAENDEEYISHSVKLLKSLAPVAEKNGVYFALENLGMYLNRPEVVVPILKGVDSQWVGIANDICNMYWFGHPVNKLYELAKAVAPYVKYVHVKSIKYPDDKKRIQRKPGWEYGKYAEPVRTGDIDFKRILRIYAEAGFKGDVTIEDDSLGKFDAEGKKKVLVDDVKLLRDLVADMK